MGLQTGGGGGVFILIEILQSHISVTLVKSLSLPRPSTKSESDLMSPETTSSSPTFSLLPFSLPFFQPQRHSSLQCIFAEHLLCVRNSARHRGCS